MSSPQHPVQLNRACLPADLSGAPSRLAGKIQPVTTRERAAAIALGSVRAEGLEPEPAVVELLERWGRREINDAEFAKAQKTLATHGTLTPDNRTDLAI